MRTDNCRIGLSYRRSFGRHVLDHADDIGLLELIADNIPEAIDEELVKTLATRFPIACHSLSLSVGSDEPMNGAYIERVARIAELTRAQWLSDHLAMTRIGGIQLSHIAPVAFSWRSVEIVAKNLNEVRRHVDIPIILENISYYIRVPGGELSEWQFLTEVCRAAQCGLLLDLNNLYVNSMNHAYDPFEFLAGIPLDRVIQVHVAGCQARDGIIVDSHASPVGSDVWTYLDWILARCEPRGIVLEWDRDFPPFHMIVEELGKARAIVARSNSLKWGKTLGIRQ
jgi:uncharacterized protein (UPF0276 family)